MCKESFPLVLNGFKLYLWGYPYNPWQYKTEPYNINLFVGYISPTKHQSRTTKSLSGLLLLLFWDFMKHFFLLLGMNYLVSTRIQQTIPFTRNLFPFFQKKNSMETFRKWKNELIEGFKDRNWLGVNFSKVSHGSSKSTSMLLMALEVV